jgi:hypothetical protein
MAQIKNSIAWPNAPDRTSQVNQALADCYFAAHPDRIYKPRVNKYNIVGDRVEESKTVVVHEFTMGDVDDPDLYAAQPLYEWQHSEAGQWVMNNAVDTPTWHRMADPMSYGYRYQITATLMGPTLTEWLLRHGSK